MTKHVRIVLSVVCFCSFRYRRAAFVGKTVEHFDNFDSIFATQHASRVLEFTKSLPRSNWSESYDKSKIKIQSSPDKVGCWSRRRGWWGRQPCPGCPAAPPPWSRSDQHHQQLVHDYDHRPLLLFTICMDVRTELKGNTCKSNLDFSASTGDSKKQRGRYGREKENNSQSCKMVSISQIFLFRKKENETVYFNQSRFPPVFVLILSMIKSSGIILSS